MFQKSKKAFQRRNKLRKTLKLKGLRKKTRKLVQIGGGFDDKVNYYVSALKYSLNKYDVKLIALYMFLHGLFESSGVSEEHVFDLLKTKDGNAIQLNKTYEFIMQKMTLLQKTKSKNIVAPHILRTAARENISNFQNWLKMHETTEARIILPSYLFDNDADLDIISKIFNADGVISETYNSFDGLKIGAIENYVESWAEQIQSRRSDRTLLYHNPPPPLPENENVNDNEQFLPPLPPPRRSLPSTIMHYWFKAWPDHGVPEIIPYIEYIKDIYYNDILPNRGNTVIHCSAGVGRTGVVYITLLLMLNYNFRGTYTGRSHDSQLGYYIKESTPIDISDIRDAILSARKYIRHNLVQTKEQFAFLCNIFNVSGIEQQLDGIWDILVAQPTGTPDHKDNYKIGKANAGKNRYSNILPYDSNYYKSSTVPYVNASLSFVNGLTFILTQCPKPNTFNDFWQMVKEKNVKRIIMVTGLMEAGKLKCNEYFRPNTSVNNRPKLSLNREIISAIYEKRIFNLTL